MKILHISTKDTGGAAIAGIRLHKGLLQQGVDSKFLFYEEKTNEIEQSYYWKRKKNTLKQQLVDKLIFRHSVQQKNGRKLHGLPRNYDMFSFPNSDVDITHHPLYYEADVINLHWVPRFLDYSSFFKKCKKPLVWTLHDMNPFSGGFHYQSDLIRNSGKILELDQQVRSVKNEVYSRSQSFTVITPSRWMYQEAKNSELFRRFPVKQIPYGLDTSLFKLYDQAFARRVFNLPQDKKILLFISDALDNKRKGFDLLLKAVSAIEDDSLWLCAVGKASAEISELRNVSYLGRVNDERLIALLYNACDAFVLPSREDNLPNVMLESIACGVPVIAFPIGGVPDVIKEGKNGILAEEVSDVSLRKAITKFLSNRYYFEREEIHKAADANYRLDKQAESYIELYHSLLGV
ncbi:glycosyltransferase [Tunicatimonas pelagia]|uniref:glycosyltransferase n=1 Tax=Tunicatimonas pelagia TaxID=931531 RepID=UPI0026650A95|nr:glycosyltransferase [Tunicatimonas pelagia]WKN40715.1 glycosyltransferase [Tunicatimonas pelagia]